MISIQERYRAAAIGTGIGDALAAPYENRRSEIIRPQIERRGGLVPHDYIDPWYGKKQMYAGQPTDDTELAAALMQSLIAHPEFDEIDLYHRLRKFIWERVALLTPEAYGFGGTLKKALSEPRYIDSLMKFERGEIPIIPTNGSLMRCIGVPLAYRGDTERMIEIARRQSCITHRHPSAPAACIAFSVLVSLILEGNEIAEAWNLTKDCLSKEPYRSIEGLPEILAVDTAEPNDDDVWPQTGSVVFSFRAALWASLTAEDFRDGITKVTLLGGDTDTYAAIAGGILGVRFGYEGIPAEWRSVLQGREVLESLADQLYEIAH
jgi:ADP-ribosyl-[dinitrogen reductase] hydrolase